jgi:hypothetical protein
MFGLSEMIVIAAILVVLLAMGVGLAFGVWLLTRKPK